ncbi:MAG TPA: hypothetical protein EYH36_00215 [Desulfocapsa sulfexigens]|nr:hypothetical protein [Desulfocapsa sulfexigens]
MVKTGRIDFLLANSAIFVEMEKKHQARAIITVVNSLGHKSSDRFGEVLFTRKNSDIKELQIRHLSSGLPFFLNRVRGLDKHQKIAACMR